MPKAMQKYTKYRINFMDNLAIKHLQDLYGLNPNIPHVAFQFPRLPPGLTHPLFKIWLGFAMCWIFAAIFIAGPIKST